MALPSSRDRRRTPIDLHRDDSFRSITELPWEPPLSAPMPHANIPVEFSGMAPDYARAALHTAASTCAKAEMNRAAERNVGGE